MTVRDQSNNLTRQPIYVFNTPVWGENHVQLFLEICIPSLLADNNLPALSRLGEVHYVIYTTKKDYDTIADNRLIAQLSRMINLRIEIFKNNFANNHLAMNYCHQAGIQEAVNLKGFAIFVLPDCIWSNQAMSAMHNIVQHGYEMIHVTGIRITKEYFYTPILRHTKNATISLTPRELVDICLRCLHPIAEQHFYEEKSGTLMPSNLFWSVSEADILAHCFHLHPLLIDCSKMSNSVKFESTVDDDLSLKMGISEDKEYIVSDSDEIVLFEISPLEHSVLTAYKKGCPRQVALWARSSTNEKHLKYVKKAIRIHSSQIDKQLWKCTEKHAKAVIKKSLKYLDKDYIDFSTLLIRYSIMFSPDSIASYIYTNKLTKPAISVISTSLRYAASLFDLLYKDSEKIPYPWTWEYILLKKIRNFYNKFCTSNINRVLVINPDSSTYKLLGDNKKILGQKYTIEYRNASSIPEFTQLKPFEFSISYDLIIITEGTIVERNTITLLSNMLNKNGKLLIHTKATHYKYLITTNNHMRLAKTTNLGGVVISGAYIIYYSSTYLSKIFPFKYSIVRNALAIFLSPILLLLNAFYAGISYILDKITSDKHTSYICMEYEKMS